jgi:hypothetical protein
MLGPYDFDAKRPFGSAAPEFDPNERRRIPIMVKPSARIPENYPLPPIGKNQVSILFQKFIYVLCS